MKVLLLNPPWFTKSGFGVRTNSRWPHTRKDKQLPFPVYLAYTSALLDKNNIENDIIDAVAEEMNVEQLILKIFEKKYDAIFFETSTPSIDVDLETARLVKNKFGNIHLSLIGPHSTFYDTEILNKYNFIDSIVRGEFEYTILELIKALTKSRPLSSINGLTYRTQQGIKKNPNRELMENLDELPFPLRDKLNMKYYDNHLFKSPSFMMISSRGCPYQCTFCLWPQVMYGHKFRYRSALNVVDEVEFLIKNYGAKEVYFDDDTFTINKKRVIAICDEIMKRNIKLSWSCFGRIDLDEEILLPMRKAGCELIKYGIESGNQQLLDNCKKKMDLSKVEKIFELTKRAKMKAYGTFMFGLPGETFETAQQTVELAKKIKADVVQFSIVTPFPGTEYFEELKNKGRLKINNWADLDGSNKAVIETEKLKTGDLEYIFARAWKEFYLRPSYIIQSLINYFKSFDDLKRLYKGFISFLRRYAYYRRLLKHEKR